MSILGSIMSSIFGGGPKAPPPSPQSLAGFEGTPKSEGAPAPAAPAPEPAASAATRPAQPSSGQVDIAAVLDGLAEESHQKLDWRHSIVDLMKLLKLDSGLAARKKLAQELRYTGDTKDSAAMNVWLHRQVMLKLAENGGKVPAELKH
jgi:hypothetical protein